MRQKNLITYLVLLCLFVLPGVAEAKQRAAKKNGRAVAKVSSSRSVRAGKVVGRASRSKSKAVMARGKGRRATVVALGRRGRVRAVAVRHASPQTPSSERYLEIQQALVDRGYLQASADGAWTPECTEAVKRFQQDQSLKVDGKLGALTIIALGLGPKYEESIDLESLLR